MQLRSRKNNNNTQSKRTTTVGGENKTRVPTPKKHAKNSTRRGEDSRHLDDAFEREKNESDEGENESDDDEVSDESLEENSVDEEKTTSSSSRPTFTVVLVAIASIAALALLVFQILTPTQPSSSTPAAPPRNIKLSPHRLEGLSHDVEQTIRTFARDLIRCSGVSSTRVSSFDSFAKSIHISTTPTVGRVIAASVIKFFRDSGISADDLLEMAGRDAKNDDDDATKATERKIQNSLANAARRRLGNLKTNDVPHVFILRDLPSEDLMAFKPLIDQETTRVPGTSTPQRLAGAGFIILDTTLEERETCDAADLATHALERLGWRKNFYTRIQYHVKVCGSS